MPHPTSSPAHEAVGVRIPAARATLSGDLVVPSAVHGIVLFAHGSGSSRLSSRNRWVAEQLQQQGLATLLFDLLTPAEEIIDATTAQYRFDIPMLARRLVAATDWVVGREDIGALPLGYFGASTGAGAALIAAATTPARVHAVVSRGGRPDLAHEHLARVRAPTLLIVGGQDRQVLALNEEARARMSAPCEIAIVPGATHLFEEPGALDRVAQLAAAWFGQHLTRRS